MKINDNKKEYLNDKYVIKYIDYIKYEKKLSDNTVLSYLNDIEKLYNYDKYYFK